MKNKAGIISLSVVIAEFTVFLLWGFLMDPVDAMGYGLIVIYGIMPLTALIISAILAHKKTLFSIPVFILALLSHIILPFLVYGTFEIALSFFLSAIPYAVGTGIGLLINKFKSK